MDWYLYDYKDSNPERFKKNIGPGFDCVFRNLFLLDHAGARIILRCPIIPGINDTQAHFVQIAELAKQLLHLERIEIEPGHAIGESKYNALGHTHPPVHITPPGSDTIQHWIHFLRSQTPIPVQLA